MNGYSDRKRSTKRQYDVFLIVCEGNKTERIYFNRFRKRGNNLQILTPDTKYTDPGNLVDFAIEQKRALDLNTNTGDRVWCVFDVDENTSKPIDDAVKKAGSNDIGIVLSNPCFEVWYLLHYCDWTRARSGKEVVNELVAHLPHYSKSEDIFDELEQNVRRPPNGQTVWSRCIPRIKGTNSMWNRTLAPWFTPSYVQY